MTRRAVRDYNGDPLALRDVYHADDPDLRTPTEMHVHPRDCDRCWAGDCWGALIPGVGGCVNGCRARAIEGGLCIRCCEKRARDEEWHGGESA